MSRFLRAPRPTAPYALRRSADLGAGTAEYGAVILLVAAVAGTVVASTGVPERVSGLIGDAVCAVPADDACADADGTGPASAGAPTGSDAPDRPTGEADAPAPAVDPAVDPEIRPEWDTLPTDTALCAPLCSPTVPLESAMFLPNGYPEESVAETADREHAGADLGDVSGCDFWTLCLEHEIEGAHDDVREWVDDEAPRPNDIAAEALRRYLDGDGRTMAIDTDRLLEDVPEFQEAVTAAQHEIGRQAIAEAKRIPRDELGDSVTFPVNAPWRTFGPGEDGTGFAYEDPIWRDTLGDWQYNVHGTARVVPPQEPGGEWTYEVESGLNIETEYGFGPSRDGDALWGDSGDGPLGVGTEVGREELHDMHRTGLARGFTITGGEDGTPTSVTGP
ncbi:hypothetical protein [Nocardiopsis trehalosi]|uniref:hypothetical protein n=1 Tax=Nocardiopsis trehalosi TaxID=109329 RepID=UPI000833EE88|nr:hypothetical protein [Nocardiopsis trehalosi]